MVDGKKPEAKPKTKAVPKTPTLMDWNTAALAIEAELKEKGWDSAKQRRNPTYLQGLLMRHIARPLIKAIHSKKGA